MNDLRGNGDQQIQGRVAVNRKCGNRPSGGSHTHVERAGICKIFYFHGTNDRSKNALCTVSPSGGKTTRRYLPSASWIEAQRRMRPSSCTVSRSGYFTTCSIHSSLIVERSCSCRTVSKYRVNFTPSQICSGGCIIKGVARLRSRSELPCQCIAERVHQLNSLCGLWFHRSSRLSRQHHDEVSNSTHLLEQSLRSKNADCP